MGYVFLPLKCLCTSMSIFSIFLTFYKSLFGSLMYREVLKNLRSFWTKKRKTAFICLQKMKICIKQMFLFFLLKKEGKKDPK